MSPESASTASDPSRCIVSNPWNRRILRPRRSAADDPWLTTAQAWGDEDAGKCGRSGLSDLTHQLYT